MTQIRPDLFQTVKAAERELEVSRVISHATGKSLLAHILELDSRCTRLREAHAPIQKSLKETRRNNIRLASDSQMLGSICHLVESKDLPDGCTTLQAVELLIKERGQLKAKINSLHSALLRVTEELESWKATEDCPESIMAIRVGKSAARSTPAESLAAHDAAVIERALELIGYPCTRHKDFGVDYTKGFNSACEMISQQAKQLRQQAQSESHLKDSQ